MKFLTLMLTLILCLKADARTDIIIDVAASEKGTTYIVNGQPRDLDDLEALFVVVVKEGINDPVYVRPDSRVSFHDVYAVLLRLKNAGIDQMEIAAGPIKAEANDLWLSIRAKDLRQETDKPAKDFK